MTTKLLFVASLITMTFVSQSTPLEINGDDINDIIKPGSMLVLENEDANNIAFSCSEHKFEIGNLIIEKDTLELSKEFYEKLKEYKDALIHSGSSTVFYHEMLHDMIFDRAYIKGEGIVLRTEEDLVIQSSIIDSEEIIITASKFNLQHCFVKKQCIVRLQASSDDSLIQMIKITFANDEAPAGIMQGSVDMDTGKTKDECTFIGATRLEILFHPKAFK